MITTQMPRPASPPQGVQMANTELPPDAADEAAGSSVRRRRPDRWPRQPVRVEYEDPERHGISDKRLANALRFIWWTGIDPARATRDEFEAAQLWLASIPEVPND